MKFNNNNQDIIEQDLIELNKNIIRLQTKMELKKQKRDMQDPQDKKKIKLYQIMAYKLKKELADRVAIDRIRASVDMGERA